MPTIVEIRVQIEGLHKYPEAPHSVDYLTHIHRHTFVITAGFNVNHNNREKEIFMYREALEKYLKLTYGSPCEFRTLSCEQIAHVILQRFIRVDMVWCRVWEENTGGAKVSL